MFLPMTLTTMNKNTFEEAIDHLTIEEIRKTDSEVADSLLVLPKDQKRIGILSVLDNDRDLFMKVFKLVRENKVSAVEHIDEVVTMLREYVGVGEVEKKKFGEVMTPISLVENMLDTLPKDVWANPNLKWIDPCNGVGIFPCIVVQRLMRGLVDFQPDEELRYKHIVENMLYVSELQAKNMFLFLCAFDPMDKYELNIFHGSFLSEEFDKHCKEVWGVEKFDIFVQNPPYQEQKEGFKKTQPLWNKFVLKSLDVLSEGGYLCAVHPSGWRNVDGMFKDVQNELKSRKMIYLEIHSVEDGLKVFGAETRYDFYTVRNLPSDGNFTKIKCQDGSFEEVDISKMEFIPNGMFKEIFDLVAKDGESLVEIIADSKYHTQRTDLVSKERSDKFSHEIISLVRKSGEVELVYSSGNRGHFGKPKVIWSNTRMTSIGTYVDQTGKYGVNQYCYAICDLPENLINIANCLKNKSFQEVMSNCINGSFPALPKNVLKTFKKDFWKKFV